MAAGLGFKDFTTGEVLTAADVDGYLMQGIWVFASTAARNAAVTSPQEGNFAFTKDTNSLWYYDGAAWVASGATGDIEGVTAGIGISGGGTSGTVTVTNSMATAIDAKGDLVAGTGADTFAKLTVGANNTVLTADSAEATGLKWATPASGGGMTLLTTHTLSGSTSSISSISGSYKSLFGVITGATTNGGGANWQINPNGSNSITNNVFLASYSSTPAYYAYPALWYLNANAAKTTGGENCWSFTINNYASTTGHKPIIWFGQFLEQNSGTEKCAIHGGGGIRTNSAITSLDFVTNSGSWTAGTVLLYGVS